MQGSGSSPALPVLKFLFLLRILSRLHQRAPRKLKAATTLAAGMPLHTPHEQANHREYQYAGGHRE